MTTTPPATDQDRALAVRRGPRLLVWAAVVIAVLAIGIGAVFGARLGKDPTLVDTPLIGTRVPDRQVPYLEGTGSLSLSQFRGQVVVVNFWASWCIACRKEHPELLAAANAYRDRGVQFVGVVYQDRKATATAFLDEMGRGGTNYRYVTDPDSRMAIDFGVFGVPETFFIGRDGKIAAKITGASTFPLLSGTINALLANQSPDPSVKTGPVKSGPGS